MTLDCWCWWCNCVRNVLLTHTVPFNANQALFKCLSLPEYCYWQTMCIHIHIGSECVCMYGFKYSTSIICVAKSRYSQWYWASINSTSCKRTCKEICFALVALDMLKDKPGNLWVIKLLGQVKVWSPPMFERLETPDDSRKHNWCAQMNHD